MKVKRWLVAATVLAVIAVVPAPLLAANLHKLLLRQPDQCTWRLTQCWKLLLSDPKPMQFYLLLCGLALVVLVGILLTSNYLDYQGGMQHITPDIVTPKPAGQGQCGTARWMRQDDIPRAFAVARMSEQDPMLQALLDKGRQSYLEVEQYAKAHPDAVRTVEE